MKQAYIIIYLGFLSIIVIGMIFIYSVNQGAINHQRLLDYCEYVSKGQIWVIDEEEFCVNNTKKVSLRDVIYG